jgi:predicted  nucleic acid-binding Zn-ribbon protein
MGTMDKKLLARMLADALGELEAVKATNAILRTSLRAADGREAALAYEVTALDEENAELSEIIAAGDRRQALLENRLSAFAGYEDHLSALEPALNTASEEIVTLREMAAARSEEANYLRLENGWLKEALEDQKELTPEDGKSRRMLASMVAGMEE